VWVLEAKRRMKKELVDIREVAVMEERKKICAESRGTYMVVAFTQRSTKREATMLRFVFGRVRG
jgi:hypothetical protein